MKKKSFSKAKQYRYATKYRHPLAIKTIDENINL